MGPSLQTSCFHPKILHALSSAPISLATVTSSSSYHLIVASLVPTWLQPFFTSTLARFGEKVLRVTMSRCRSSRNAWAQAYGDYLQINAFPGLVVVERERFTKQMDPGEWSDVSAWFIRAVNHVLDRSYFRRDNQMVVRTIPKPDNNTKNDYDYDHNRRQQVLDEKHIIHGIKSLDQKSGSEEAWHQKVDVGW